MRKLLLLICLFFAISAEAQESQYYKHSISVGAGLWVRLGAEDHSYNDPNHLLYEANGKYSPIPSISYQYMMSPHWSLGGTASMLNWHRKIKYIESGETADKKSETMLSVMFTARYYWRTRNWVRIYSSASVGLGYDWEKRYDWEKSLQHLEDRERILPCGQLTPLGIEVGNGHLIGFGELGLGMTGWLRAGIGYRF